MPTPTSYVYTISTEIPSGLVSVARLRQEIELSSIVTMIDFVAGGIAAPGNDTVTVWFKDPLSAGEKLTFDGGASAPAEHPPISGSLLYNHSGLALPDDPQNVNVSGGSVSVTSGTIDADGKILSPNNVDFLGDAANPLRVDPTGSTVQPVSVGSLPLPSGAATQATLATLATEATAALIKAKTDNLDVALSTRATESTLAALNTNAADIETILAAIRDTAGVKKITDPLPAGTNNIGDVDVASSALPAGAATEATVATLATQATAALIKTKTDNLDVTLSTRATEVTVAAINTATGATGDADTANTIIGRLKQLVTKLAGGLPAALVGGRLDSNIGAWLGSTVPTVGQKSMANSIPVVIPSDQLIGVISGAAEEATFTVVALVVVLGNNKSLISVYNPTASTKVLKLREYYVRNAQTTAVTGVAAQLEIRRFASASAPTGGTVLTPAEHDTTEALGADVDCRTGSTISGETAQQLDVMRISSDEWGPGTLDQEGAQQTISNYLPARVKRDAQQTALCILRAGQGAHLKCATNTTAGAFDLLFVFTQV